jgi:hypothetical protein
MDREYAPQAHKPVSNPQKGIKRAASDTLDFPEKKQNRTVTYTKFNIIEGGKTFYYEGKADCETLCMIKKEEPSHKPGHRIANVSHYKGSMPNYEYKFKAEVIEICFEGEITTTVLKSIYYTGIIRGAEKKVKEKAGKKITEFDAETESIRKIYKEGGNSEEFYKGDRGRESLERTLKDGVESFYEGNPGSESLKRRIMPDGTEQYFVGEKGKEVLLSEIKDTILTEYLTDDTYSKVVTYLSGDFNRYKERNGEHILFSRYYRDSMTVFDENGKKILTTKYKQQHSHPETSLEIPKCCKCNINYSNCMFSECGHLCICSACANKLYEQEGREDVECPRKDCLNGRSRIVRCVI